jgi:hypothetical protein
VAGRWQLAVRTLPTVTRSSVLAAFGKLTNYSSGLHA